MNAKTLNLHINKLVIDGLGEVDRHNVGIAVETELHRLLTAREPQGLLKQSRSIKAIDAKPIVYTRTGRGRRLGQQIAKTVYRGIKQ